MSVIELVKQFSVRAHVDKDRHAKDVTFFSLFLLK